MDHPKTVKIIFLLIPVLILFACQSKEEELKQQLKNKVGKFYELEKYKDYEGMAEFVLLKKNITVPSTEGEYTFKDSRDFFISIFNSNLRPGVLMEYKIFSIEFSPSYKEAIVKTGLKYEVGLRKNSTMESLKWIYNNNNWFVDVTDEEYSLKISINK